MDLSHFNPNAQSEADFRAGFIARRNTLDFFLKQLALTLPGQPARQHLIVAPRGFGKTSMLRRIAIGVREDAALNARYLPLRFREEQHNVISLDLFWRNCLLSLLEAREDQGAAQDELDAIDADWCAQGPRQGLPRDEQDGEPARLVLYGRCAELGRRPLLLIDNLDTLLAGLSPHHQWGLRRRLQAEDGPALIAAAPRYPDATHDPDAAFYEFFRVQTLDKLADAEVFDCLRNLAVLRGDAGEPVLRLLAHDPGRIAALNTLAGGNPRTLGVLYAVLESHKSDDVLSQLGTMLDTFTGWYQARTEELPMQARAVFDALALNWDPMTAAALGQATGLDTPAVSSQLTRLEKSGYVETVALSSRGKGRSGYQVSERFFNIWYLMRNGSRRVGQSIRFLTQFVQACFNAGERRSLAMTALASQRAEPEFALALASSLSDDGLRQQLFDLAMARSQETGEADHYRPLIAAMRETINRQPDLEAKAATRGVEPETAIKRFNRQIKALFGRQDSESREQVAQALVNKANTLATTGRPDQAIEVYDEVVACFGTATEVALREQVAKAILYKGVALGDAGNPEEAIAAYDEVVKRFGTEDAVALGELVARAIVNKGFRLGVLGRPDQEIAAYDEVVERFGTAIKVALREQVAWALVNKGITLASNGHPDQAIEVYDDVVERFGNSTEAELRERVAWALVNKGITLASNGHPDQAIGVYDDVVERFGASIEAELRERVAWALAEKGFRLGVLGRPGQEIAVYDELVARFGTAIEVTLRQEVAWALVNKGITLAGNGHPDQAIAIYDEVVERFGTSTEVALRERVALALVNKGIALGDMGRPEREIAVYDEVVERFGTDNEVRLREIVARALRYKGVTLGEMGRPDQEIAVYDEVVERFAAATEVSLREQVSGALVNKGVALGASGHPEQEIAVYTEVVQRFGTATEATVQEQVARALVNQGFRFGIMGYPDKAIAVYDEVIERFGAATEAALREQVATALVNKGRGLGAMGKLDEENGIYDEVIERFGMATETALRKRVTIAQIRRGNLLLDELGDIEAACSSFDAALATALSPAAKGMPAANLAYLHALHGGDDQQARTHATTALADDAGLSPAGRQLLRALPIWNDHADPDWPAMFEPIGQALAMNDPQLWTNHIDDLQRLLWFILAQGQGQTFRQWMDKAGIRDRYAPLYHAFVAALDGEDHLLLINPEVRQPAARIHAGLARRLRLYGGDKSSRKSERSQRSA